MVQAYDAGKEEVASESGVLKLGSHDSNLYKKNRAYLRKTGEQNHIPCYYCGSPINYFARQNSPLAFTVDHKIPVAAGGSDHLDNLVRAHNKCNRAKSDHFAEPLKRDTRVMTTKKWW
jgi:5-methylcytosine-specific restriction endonuclease McrA